MVPYLGDYDTTETVVLPFNTFTSDDPSASVTITDFANTDVHIFNFAGDALVQRTSSAGVTIDIDTDTFVGAHLIAIDLSDNTDTGFYAAGSRYQVLIEGTTVDAATVTAWVGTFSVGCTLRPTTAGRKLDVTATGAGGIDWANVENPTTAVDLSATDIQLCDTVTTNTDLVSAAAVVNEWETQSQADPTGFHVNVLEVGGTAQTANDIGADANTLITEVGKIPKSDGSSGWNATALAAIEAEVEDALQAMNLDHLLAVADADDVVNNSVIAKMVSSAATADWSGFVNTTDSLQATRDKLTDIETDTAEIGTAGAGLTDLGGMSTAMKAEVNAEADTALTDYDAPTKTEMDSAFTEIKGATWASGTDTLEHIRNKQTDIETDTAEIGTAGDGLTGIPWNASWDAEVQSECTDALNAYDPPTRSEMDTAHGLLATPAQVNTEVSDVLKTDTITLPAQGAPSATPTMEDVLAWIYKTFRNKKTQTATTWSLFDDAGTTVDSQATVSDDGTTATKGEIVSG